jgi:hypothetical protein
MNSTQNENKWGLAKIANGLEGSGVRRKRWRILRQLDKERLEKKYDLELVS